MYDLLPAVQTTNPAYRRVRRTHPGETVGLNPQPLPPKQGIIAILIGL